MKRLSGTILGVLAAGFATIVFAQPDTATMVLMCDTNGDNAVTQKEWQACGAPTAYPADADKNKDGRVSVDEVAAPKGPEQPPPQPEPGAPH